jgi:hypothetical protein
MLGSPDNKNNDYNAVSDDTVDDEYEDLTDDDSVK